MRTTSAVMITVVNISRYTLTHVVALTCNDIIGASIFAHKNDLVFQGEWNQLFREWNGPWVLLSSEFASLALSLIVAALMREMSR
jgi:hypothetical protein